MTLRSRIALAMLLLATASTRSQTMTTGQVAGTVTDPSGALLPHAQVSLFNERTGAKRMTESNAEGYYIMPLLDPGRYVVIAGAKGFETVSRDGITVEVGRSTLVDFHLKVGSEGVRVTISSSPQLIEPNNPNTTTTFSAAQLASIPNPGNDLSYVANLASGALVNPTATGASFAVGGSTEVNGLPAGANNLAIDGIDTNDPFSNLFGTGASGLELGLNAVDEVSINTTAYGVGQGRLGASQIDYVTKSGTNQFHGNAYELWNGSAMNANNFFLNANGQRKPRSNVNEFGASVGGPIRKDKLFFFADLEGIRLILPTVLNTTVPSPTYQSYVLGQLPLGGTDTVLDMQLPPEPEEVAPYQKMFSIILDPGRGTPLATLGCPLNADGSSAAGSPPDGDGCANMRLSTVAPPVVETLFTAKLDYHLRDADHFWFRFQVNNGHQTLPDSVNPMFDTVSSSPLRSAALGWTHVFTPHLVNQINPGVDYRLSRFGLADPAKAAGILPLSYAAANFSTLGGNQFANPSGNAATSWQLNDTLTWIRQKQEFKFGASMRRTLADYINGTFVLPLDVAASLPEFTYGASAETVEAFPEFTADRLALVNLDLYAMDTVRVTSKFTATLGLRGSWNSDPVSRHDFFSRLNGSFDTISHDVNRPLNLDILASKQQMFAATPLVQWQPRIAFAYELTPKTALRSGFGVFEQILAVGGASNLFQNAPSNNSILAGLFEPAGGIGVFPGVPNSSIGAAVVANQQFDANFNSGALSCASSSASPNACVPAISFNDYVPGNDGKEKYPYFMQWSASIERQLGDTLGLTLGYVGTRSLNGIYIENSNAYQTVCAGCFAPFSFGAPADPRFASITTNRTGANSSYHALQSRVQKRVSHGLTLQANYTYSHCLDTASNGGALVFNQNSGVTPSPGELKRLYGNCDYDVRHSVNGSYVYEFPFHSERRWIDRAIAGWQVSGTVFARSGLPFSVVGAVPRGSFFNAFPTIFPNRIPGQSEYQKKPIATTLPGTIQWLDPNAFQSAWDTDSGSCFPVSTPQNCQSGNVGRNTLRGPGFRWADVSIGKTLALAEGVRFKFDAQFYNVFNHPNFGLPNNGFVIAGIPGDPATLTNFGTIDATVSPSTSLLGGSLGGDSSVRMIALRGTITF